MNISDVYKWLLNNQICPLCDLPKEGGSPLCSSCSANLHRNVKQCRRCAIPLTTGATTCDTCDRLPPLVDQGFDLAFAPLLYRFPLPALFHQIKQGKNPEQLNWMGELLADEFLSQWQLDPGFTIIAIPMHPIDQVIRGFNQTEIFAKKLAQKSGLTISKALKKSIRTAHQAGLKRFERLKNLEQPYQVSGTAPERVILIDDIHTTGATLQAASSALKLAGSEEIIALTLCRTPF